MRYRLRLGCRFGLPHDMRIIHENAHAKWEVCQICGKRYRFNKNAKGRTDNRKYLELHVRNFAQKNGATKRIYNRIYNPSKCTIAL